MKALGDWMVYVTVRIFLGILAVLPRALAYRLCEALATLIFWLDRKHRRIGMINLNIAFPEGTEQWKRDVLRRSFQQVGDHVVEVSRLHRLSREEASKRVRYEPGRGLEHYLEAKKRAGKVLFLTAHVSAWELLPTAHALQGHPLGFLVRPLDNVYLEAWARRLRNRFGNQTLNKRGAMRTILRRLEAEGDVGFLLDQNAQERDGVYVPFFGRPASTSSALAALALRTAAPVIPGFILPAGRRGYYTIRFYPPVELMRNGDPEVLLAENTARFNRCIEDVIREYPHCWLWGHRRFHTQPDGKHPYRVVSA